MMYTHSIFHLVAKLSLIKYIARIVRVPGTRREELGQPDLLRVSLLV